MPRGDRTGPNGAGSMTGRGVGLCSGNTTGGFTSGGMGGRFGAGIGAGNGAGRGLGMGQNTGRNLGGRGGRCFNRAWVATPTAPADNSSRLQQQMNNMQQQLDTITASIKNLLNK